MSIQDIPQISELSIFSALPEESQHFLQDRMRRVDYPAGAMIVRAGMRCDYMAIVTGGALELRSVSGEVHLIDQGGLFGQAMMRYAVPSAFSVLTTMPTTLWVIGRTDWLAANYIAREESERHHRKINRAAPKSIPLSLAGLKSRSTRERSSPARHTSRNRLPNFGLTGLFAHVQGLSRRNPRAAPSLETASEPPARDRKSPIYFPRKVLVALLFVGLMLVVVGPTFVGWADFTLVRLCLQAQQPKWAESYLTLAISWRPNSAVLQDALGYVRYLQVNPDQALEEFRRAVELQPDLASAQNNLGVSLLGRGLASEALSHLEAAVNLDPSNATAYVNLGNAYLAVGDSTEAMKAFADAYTLDPSQAAAQAHWAILALKEGRVAEARRILQKAAATDPKLALARQGLGVAALLEGQPAAALPELETARRLDPQDASTNLYLGLALKDLDRPADAAIEFIQVLSLSQDPQVLDLARENLQRVYEKLIPGGGASHDLTPSAGLLQKGGMPATDH
jgi:tetratricopeptide (TPR) repeat protein/CRP-like cAMP-binding protein